MIKKLKKLRAWINSEPSNSLQKLNILSSFVFSAAATFLAVMTYNSYTQIEGMEEMLNSFKAKPKLNAQSIFLKKDKLGIESFVKNYGSRPAMNVSVEIFFVTETAVFQQPNIDPIMEVVPNEKYNLDAYCYLRATDMFGEEKTVGFEELKQVKTAFKVVYYDAVTGKKDSSYNFAVAMSPLIDSVTLRMAKPEEIKEIIKSVDNTYPERSFKKE